MNSPVELKKPNRNTSYDETYKAGTKKDTGLNTHTMQLKIACKNL
ncbi:hypothetical protein SAMN05216599_12072 [Pseudomonas cichorii]|uniref:Uncharacterized protein n=1 Tax=Pseudomonas cichorii TaxID=36746 RepID=A0ABQ1DUH9_PSECI|nr:hypothetical protein PSCICP_45550 [Pseudomonas cichorii]SDP15377.1 hypothetical protein SAMN05216599_12072 [Pseudomonas cichorii]